MNRPDLSEQLISSGDIAGLLGVGRAAVSNYKTRHPGFPAPAYRDSTGRVQLYWVDEVHAWIAKHFGNLAEQADSLERRAGEMQARAERLRGLSQGAPSGAESEA